MKRSIQQKQRVIGELCVAEGQPATLKRGQLGPMKARMTEWLRGRGLITAPRNRRKL